MAFTTSAIESLVQILATGNDFRTTNRVKCQYTGAIELIRNRGNDELMYAIQGRVNFENLEIVQKNRMYKAYKFLEGQNYVVEGGRKVASRFAKNFIKLVHPTTGLVAWFDWEGDVYQYIEGEPHAVLTMRRGKLTEEA